MSSRISLDPKIFPIIFENWPPIFLSVLPRQSLGDLKDATRCSCGVLQNDAGLQCKAELEYGSSCRHIQRRKSVLIRTA